MGSSSSSSWFRSSNTSWALLNSSSAYVVKETTIPLNPQPQKRTYFFHPLHFFCQGLGLLETMALLPQTHALPSLEFLALCKASVSEETGFPSGLWMLNSSFPKPSVVQPPATIVGRQRAGRFFIRISFFTLAILASSFFLAFCTASRWCRALS